MGMDADIIAIGKFKKELIPHLEYPANYYEDTPEGTEIIGFVLGCDTDQASRDLAEALGMDPWKFEEHRLRILKINWFLLNDFCKKHSFYAKLENFKILMKAGFTFFYRPNG